MVQHFVLFLEMPRVVNLMKCIHYQPLSNIEKSYTAEKAATVQHFFYQYLLLGRQRRADSNGSLQLL